MRLADGEIEELASAALRDPAEAERYLDSLRDRLDEKEVRGVKMAIRSAQYIKGIVSEQGISLRDTMAKLSQIPLLDDEDRIYARLMLTMLRFSGIEESNVKAEGNKPEDEGSDEPMGVGLPAGSPSPESGYYGAEDIEEEEEDEPK
ncbi:MAG: hypothetical protein QXV32_07110 [Conexivisphaerales archaeon]